MARPLLSARGARVVLGGEALAERAGAIDRARRRHVVRSARRLPCERNGGPLFVCDTGHHRLLIWRKPPRATKPTPICVIGQPDFSREGRNAKGEVGAATLNVPTGVAACDGVLAVADAWNHRVLIWHGDPEDSNRPADIVLGQADFGCGLANRGAQRAGSRYAELVLRRRHRRWPADRRRYRQSSRAGLEREFRPRTARRPIWFWGSAISPPATTMPAAGGALGMRWPHGIAAARGMLFVVRRRQQPRDGLAQVVRGGTARPAISCSARPNSTGLDHNRASYYPTLQRHEHALWRRAVQGGMLVVADTANSRLLGFELDGSRWMRPRSRSPASSCFREKGDNRWRPPRGTACAGPTAPRLAAICS